MTSGCTGSDSKKPGPSSRNPSGFLSSRSRASSSQFSGRHGQARSRHIGSLVPAASITSLDFRRLSARRPVPSARSAFPTSRNSGGQVPIAPHSTREASGDQDAAGSSRCAARALAGDPGLLAPSERNPGDHSREHGVWRTDPAPAAREATDSVVSVRDYGAGIARAMLDRVFELLVQVRAAMAARVRASAPGSLWRESCLRGTGQHRGAQRERGARQCIHCGLPYQGAAGGEPMRSAIPVWEAISRLLL